MEFVVSKVFPVAGNKTVKANAIVTVGGVIDLHCTVMEGSKGLFVTWKGTEKYTKKDGTPGYASPIFIKDEIIDKKIKGAVIERVNNTPSTPRTSSAPTATPSYDADEIPF